MVINPSDYKNWLHMSFLCPNCRTKNQIVQGQTHCAHCRHPFTSRTVPTTHRPDATRGFKSKDADSSSSWLIALFLGVASFFLFSILILGVALFWWVGKSSIAELTSSAPDVGSTEEFEKEIPAESKAAFTRRPKSTPSIPHNEATRSSEWKSSWLLPSLMLSSRSPISSLLEPSIGLKFTMPVRKSPDRLLQWSTIWMADDCSRVLA